MCDIRYVKTEPKLLKQKRREEKSPDEVLIYYHWGIKSWAVKEKYFRRNKSGVVEYGGIEKTRPIKHYRSYVFSESNHAGRIMLDMVECKDILEEDRDVYLLSPDTIRRAVKVDRETAFAIDRIYVERGGTPVCEITIYNRKTG